MPGLSIVIPALGDSAALETTLVSVLTHQPDDSEIVVVLAAPYDDPYDLASEIRFVTAPANASWAECVNFGIRHSQAPLVHPLYPGVEATEGWAEAARACFDDPRVAAVAPLVLDALQRDQVLAAGVAYRTAGARRMVRAALGRIQHPAATRPVLGPCWLGGFYRTAVLNDLIGGFEPALGETAADVDLALRLRHAGFRVAVATASHLRAPSALLEGASGEFGRSRAAEQLFWRNAPLYGWAKSLVAHAGLLAGAVAAGTLTPWRLPARWAGRAWGLFGLAAARRYHVELDALHGMAATFAADEGPRHLRIDRSHPQPAGPALRPPHELPLRRSA